MLTLQDKEQLAEKGISEKQIGEQLACFEKGFPYLRLASAASAEKGIRVLSQKEKENYLAAWEEYIGEADRTIVKFVPASGAASRMFKNLFEFLSGERDFPSTTFEKDFFARTGDFAFYDDLNEVCLQQEGADVPALLQAGKYKAVVKNLLEPEGLDYGALPKGLLKFHKYEDGARTPLEEHLVEGALYAAARSKKVNVHFTVSKEHKELFRALVKEKLKKYAGKYKAEYHISFSEQKPATDTLAVDPENNPFRDGERLVFRPGGHGALIENLNDLDGDVIFIKNIDNVVPDRLKEDTVVYKKILAGVLVTLQEQIFDYLTLLDSGYYTSEHLQEILSFTEEKLFCYASFSDGEKGKNEKAGKEADKKEEKNIREKNDKELAAYLYKKLNRPIRVCGMVKNVGEPGGGPFFAYNADGTVSLQILESSQIDMNDPAKKEMFEKGTHFNPVDLVCGVRDYKGNKFDLTKYVDKSTGFISQKSKNGKDLKALELPGLWNGAMSDWNTVFVEVPLSTFNPVKTVNDLLRPEHQ